MYYINSLHRVLWRICAKLNSSADEIEIRAKHRRLFLDDGERSGRVVVEPWPISAAVKLREPYPGYSRARALVRDAGVCIAVVDNHNGQLGRDFPVEINHRRRARGRVRIARRVLLRVVEARVCSFSKVRALLHQKSVLECSITFTIVKSLCRGLLRNGCL